MQFKELWDVESAMTVLAHKTVDGKLWAEAVEWLMLYGPAEIRQLLIESSMTATRSSFPELQPSTFTADGQPCYHLEDLARVLQMDEEKAREILKKKEADHGDLQFGSDAEDGSVH